MRQTARMFRSALVVAFVFSFGCKGGDGADSGDKKPTPVKVAPPIGVIELVIETDEPAKAAEVIKKRLGGLAMSGLAPPVESGIAEPEVRVHGERVTVTVPLAADADCAEVPRWASLIERAATRTGALGFHRTVHAEDPQAGPIVTIEHTKEQVTIKKLPELTGSDLVHAYDGMDDYGRPFVSLKFTPKGGEKFGRISAELIGKPLVIMFEGRVASAPVVREEITGGEARIDLGAGSTEEQRTEARELAAILRAGPLQAGIRVLKRHSVCTP